MDLHNIQANLTKDLDNFQFKINSLQALHQDNYNKLVKEIDIKAHDNKYTH